MTAPTAEAVLDLRQWLRDQGEEEQDPQALMVARMLLAALDYVRAELLEEYIHATDSYPGNRIDRLLAYLAPEPAP